MPLTAWLCLCISGVYFGNDDDDVDNHESDDNDNILCNSLSHMTHTNSNPHVTQFVTFLLHAFCDLSDWSNCTRTIMYVTTVDTNWNRENSTTGSIGTYGLLKCRYINLTERVQNIITVSQLYATIHIFKLIFTSLKTQLIYCRRFLFSTFHSSVPCNLVLENSALTYWVYLFVSVSVMLFWARSKNCQSDY
jgi:hypothetical protein